MRLFWPIRIILCITLLTDARLTQAQWPDYGVYHTVGTVKCAPAKGGPMQPVSKGSWVYAGDRILLYDQTSDIILFTRDSNYIHLKGKGTYTTKDLQSMQRSHVPDNITARYLSLLWEELFRPNSNGQTGGSTGGVSRGGSFMLFPPDNYLTSLDKLLFRWEPYAWATSYRLFILSARRRILYDTVIKDTQLIVPVRPPLQYGYSFHYSIQMLGDNGRRQQGAEGSFTLVDETLRIQQLQTAALDSTDTALTHAGPDSALMRAEQYEKQGCTRSADSIYLKLLAGDPTDLAVKALYREFRRRNGLD
jgi:hypothetical protein